MKQTDRFDRVNSLLEWAALGTVLNLCFYYFLKVSTFGFTWPGWYKGLTLVAVFGLGILRVGLLGWKEFQQKAEPGDRRKLLLTGAAAGLTALVCLLITYRLGYKFIACLPFAAFCLYGLDPDRVLKAFSISMGMLLVVTILCSLSGAIDNLIYMESGRQSGIRVSYGTPYPTDFAAYLVYDLILFWAAQRRRSVGHTLLFSGLALGLAWFCFSYPRSYTSTLCGILFAMAILYDGLKGAKSGGGKGRRALIRGIDALTVWAFPLFGVGMIGLTWLYGQGAGFAKTVNGWMSGRLNFGWSAWQKYGLQAFGSQTPQIGSGGELIPGGNYEFIDSSYMLLLIRYGWIFALLAACIWVWMSRKAIRSGWGRMALAMALVAFHSISEHHFPELNYNIMLAMPLCCFAGSGGRRESGERNPAREKAGWIVGAVLGAGFLLLLPGMLSGVRGLFLLEGWMKWGIHSLKAMLFWILCLILLWLGWRFLRDLLADGLSHRKVRRTGIIGLAAVAVIGVVGGLWVNQKIASGASVYQEQVEADRPALEAALTAAKDPVYARQTEAFYRRELPQIANRVFTPHELARGQRGTILLEAGDEGYQLMKTGAWYSEISAYSGLFTYDESVVEMLRNRGYEVTDYYSPVLDVDLAALAKENNLELTAEGAVRIKDRKQAILKGPGVSLYEGKYKAIFELRLTEPALRAKGEYESICRLRVRSAWGKNHLAARTVHLKDFDAEGRATVEVDFRTGSIQGVEFQVIGTNDISLEIGKISWAYRSADEQEDMER